MSGTVARSLGAMGDAIVGTANVNFDAGTLFIDSVNNNVGIGTSVPGFPLDVAGAIRGNSWIGRTNTSAPTVDAAIYRPADNTLGFVTASTERMRIDVGGRVLAPFQPAFYIHHVGDNGLNQQNTTVILNTPLINRGSAYSTSTGRYTCPVSGLYQFFFGTIKSDNGVAPDGRVSRFRIRRNGSNISTELRLSENGGYGESTSMVCMAECAANDFIDVFITDIGGWYGGTYGHFGGFLIG